MTRRILHVHFIKDFREEFHAMIVIYGHELFILLLAYLVTDAFAIDNSGHTEHSIAFFVLLDFSLLVSYRLNSDVVHLYLTSVSSFPKPTFILVYVIKAVAIHMGYASVFLLRNDIFISLSKRKRMFCHYFLSGIQFCFHFRSKIQGYLFIGIEHVYRQSI